MRCGAVYVSPTIESRFEIVIQVTKKVYKYFRVEILICQNLGLITVEFSRPLRSPPFSIEIGTGRKEGNWKGVRGKNFTRKRDGEEDRLWEEGFLLSQYRKQGWGKFDRHCRCQKIIKMYFKINTTVYTIKNIFISGPCVKNISFVHPWFNLHWLSKPSWKKSGLKIGRLFCNLTFAGNLARNFGSCWCPPSSHQTYGDKIEVDRFPNWPAEKEYPRVKNKTKQTKNLFFLF